LTGENARCDDRSAAAKLPAPDDQCAGLPFRRECGDDARMPAMISVSARMNLLNFAFIVCSLLQRITKNGSVYHGLIHILRFPIVLCGLHRQSEIILYFRADGTLKASRVIYSESALLPAIISNVGD